MRINQENAGHGQIGHLESDGRNHCRSQCQLYHQGYAEHMDRRNMAMHKTRSFIDDDEKEGADEGRGRTGGDCIESRDCDNQDAPDFADTRRHAGQRRHFQQDGIDETQMESREGQDMSRPAVPESCHGMTVESGFVACQEGLQER